MDNRYICKTCGGKMENGERLNQYVCPYCGETVIHEPTSFIDRTASFIEQTKDNKDKQAKDNKPKIQTNNDKLKKITAGLLMTASISGVIAIYCYGNFIESGPIFLILSVTLFFHLIFLRIGYITAKLNKSDEEKKKISLAYPSAWTHIMLFPVSLILAFIALFFVFEM